MSKKVFQLFSLILSILALIFMIMSHYGIIRQYYLRHKPTEYYVDKYKSLPKADKDRVVVSFPYKNDIKVFLNSILDQTVRVDDIGTTTKNKDLKLSGAEKKVVNVYTYDKDYNDTGNAICTVLREPETNCKIILLDPTKMYGKDFIQSIVEKSNENPTKIIQVEGYDIFLIKPIFFSENFVNDDTETCFELLRNHGEILKFPYMEIKNI